MLIGELAARSGRTIHTIRWYEAEGLIPGVVRDAGRRRVYRDEHLDWLDLMERLQRTGMSVAEMRAYATLVSGGRSTAGQRRDLLVRHREHVRRTIGEWKASLSLVERKIAFYDAWATTGKRPPPVTTPRPLRGASVRERSG